MITSWATTIDGCVNSSVSDDFVITPRRGKKAKIKACAIFKELRVLGIRVCVQGVSRNFCGVLFPGRGIWAGGREAQDLFPSLDLSAEKHRPSCRQCHADKTPEYLEERVLYTQERTWREHLESHEWLGYLPLLPEAERVWDGQEKRRMDRSYDTIR